MRNKMKSSGIEWVGDIPSDWKTTRLKYLTANANTGEAISKEFWDINGDYLLYTAGQLPIRSTFNEFPKSLITTENDILVARNGAGAVQIPQLGSIYTDHVIRFTVKNDICIKFIYYTLLLGMEKIISEAIDVSLKTLNRTEWDNLPLPFSVLSEQKAIAAFLDAQCGKIDNIITDLEQQIEILKQYKTSLITETVTKGLNKDAPMKNSGIDWIGKIPAHWEVGRIKDIMILQRGYDLSQDEFIDGKIPVCGSNGIIGYHNKITTKGPNITIGRSGSIGEVNYIKTDSWIHNTAIFVEDMKKNYCRYLYYVLLSNDIKNLGNGSAVPTLDRKNIQNSKFVFTKKIDEQKTIAAFLDSKCKEISDIITEKQQSINAMKTYKKSLIYEYVTGKKRVKGYS